MFSCLRFLFLVRARFVGLFLFLLSSAFIPEARFELWRRMKDLASLRHVLEHGAQRPYEDSASGGWFVDMRPLHCPDCSRPFCGLCLPSQPSSGERRLGLRNVSKPAAIRTELTTIDPLRLLALVEPFLFFSFSALLTSGTETGTVHDN